MIKKKIKEFLSRKYKSYKIYRAHVNEINKINDKRRQKLIESYPLNINQKKEIDEFFIKNYGKRVRYDWHRLYSSFTGQFDVKYFPELLFIPELEKKWVDDNYGKVFDDKNLLPYLIGEGETYRIPNTIVSCVNGIFRDSKLNFIDLDKVFNLLNDKGEFFIKPSVDSGSGKNCALINIINGKDKKTGKDLNELFNDIGKSFVIQEVLKNCKSVQQLHPNSVNTFRIVTYLLDNKVYHFPVCIRIGRNNNNVDNAHSGGMFIYVDDNGKLANCAYTEFKEVFNEHPDTKIVFKDHKVPEVKIAIDVVEKLHHRFPQIRMISWDVIVDEKGKVVIIEMNLKGQTVWFPQMASGKSAFGENTEKVLNEIRNFK